VVLSYGLGLDVLKNREENSEGKGNQIHTFEEVKKRRPP
jgi:hypothetical protein